MCDPPEWLPVVGYEGLYDVSRSGVIRSRDKRVPSRWGKTRLITGKEIRPYIDVDGYPVVTLMKNGVKKNRKVSRLVGEAHISNPRGKPLVLHRDDIKTNNTVENLYWGNHAENTRDSISNGSHARLSREKCKWGHDYTEENTRIHGTRGSRICMTCEKIYKQRSRDARSAG